MAMASSIGPAPWCSLSSPSATDAGSEPCADAGSSGSCSRARTRATAVAVAIDVPATWTMSTSVASDVSGDQRARPIDPMSSTLRHIAGTASPAGTATTTAADSAAPRNRRRAPVRWTSSSGRSVTTTTWRPSSSRSSAVATSSASSTTAACGSHRHQSHAAASSVTTTRFQSAGPLHVASCTIRARTMAFAVSPRTASAAPAPRSAATGTSSNRVAAATIASSSGGRASPSIGTSHVPRSPSERDPRRVAVLAAPRPHAGAQRRRRGHGVGDARRGRQVVAQPGGALFGDGGGERGDVPCSSSAAAPTVADRTDPPGEPHADRGEHADESEDEEHRRAQHDGDDDGPRRRERRGQQTCGAGASRGSGGARRRDRWRVPARQCPRRAVERSAPRVPHHDDRRRGAVCLLGSGEPEATRPELDRRPVDDRGRPGDRLTVDAAGHPTGQLDNGDGAVGRHGDEHVVRLDRRVVDAHGCARRATDDVTAGGQGDRRSGCRAGLTDEHGDRHVGGRCCVRCVETAATHDAGPRQRVGAGDLPAVELQERRRSEADRFGQVADAIVEGSWGHEHPAPGRVFDLERGDGHSRHAPLSARHRRKGKKCWL